MKQTRYSPAQVRLGVLMVAAGSVCFGMLPIPLEVLRGEDVKSGSTLVIRYISAVALLIFWVMWRRPRWQLSVSALVAGAALGGGTIVLFEGYAVLPASMNILVFYTYPVFALLFARLLFSVAIELRMAVAVVLVIIAAILIMSPGDIAGIPIVEVLFVFLAPMCYALYLCCVGDVGDQPGPGMRTLQVSLGAFAVVVAWQIYSEPGMHWPHTTAGWVALAYVGLITGLVATLLVVTGTVLAGSNRSAVAGSLELVTVLILGWYVLNETIRFEAVAGAVLILAAIIVSLRPRMR